MVGSCTRMARRIPNPNAEAAFVCSEQEQSGAGKFAHSRRDLSMITCVVSYVIDPAKIDAFEQFGRRWMDLVFTLQRDQAQGIPTEPRSGMRRPPHSHGRQRADRCSV